MCRLFVFPINILVFSGQRYSNKKHLPWSAYFEEIITRIDHVYMTKVNFFQIIETLPSQVSLKVNPNNFGAIVFCKEHESETNSNQYDG